MLEQVKQELENVST